MLGPGATAGADFSNPEPTIIMGGRPHQPGYASVPDLAAAPRPPMASYAQGFGETPPAPFQPAEPPAAPPRSFGSKALVLFLIGGVTMVVVILTGLLVILGSD